MSRPLNPTWNVPVHAPNANYPVTADPWSATPTKTAHPGSPSVGFTPKAGVPAQAVNKLFNDAFVTDGAAKTLLDQLVTFVGQAPALNWNAKVVAGAAGNYAAAYSEATRRWLVVGVTEDVRASTDFGRTWSGSLVAAVGANESCQTIDVNASGAAVIGTPTAFVFTLSATNTAAKVSVFAGNTTQIQIACDHVTGLFAALVYDGLSANVKTSADAGATWTVRTLPAEWSDFTTYATLTNIRAVANRTGRIVVVGQGTTGLGPSGALTCRAMTSDNGGVTWTDRGTFATTIVSPGIGELAWNADTAEYMYTIGENSGTPSGEVWLSTDGITWTKKKTFAAGYLGRVAGLGQLWVGAAAEDSGLSTAIAYSVDSGATWKRAGIVLENVHRGVYAGGGGFLALTEGYAYSSLRLGMPALGSIG